MADKTTVIDEKDQDEFTAVGPGAQEAPEQAEDNSRAAGEDYTYEDGNEEGTGDAEERAGHAESDADDGREESPSAKRRRRVREREARKDRELNFLRSRNEQLEREQSRRMAEIENRQHQTDITAIDGRIRQMEADVREAESLLTEALQKQDAGAATEALRVRDELRDGLNQAKGARGAAQRQAREAQARPQQAATPQINPAVAARAREWIQERSWFDPTGGDEDSAIAYVVEQRLHNEGRLDPSGDEYYEELDRRLSKRLPHHYKREDEDEDDREEASERRESKRTNGKENGKRRANGGPTFRTGGRERALRKGEVYIDPERRKAMEEHGVWDDPEQRQRYLAQYAKYDRENGRRNH